MSDEMKLLTALCESLGFKVVVEIDRGQKRYPPEFNMHNSGRVLVRDIKGCADIDENGWYLTQLIEPIKSYKLKSKVELVTVTLPSDTDKIVKA